MSSSNHKVAVVTGAYTNNHKEYEFLNLSSLNVGVKLNIIGFGCGYPELGLVKDLCDFLKACSEPYALVTDAFDTMFVRWNEEELVSRIEQEPSGLLISCESNCWPPGPWCEVYPTTGLQHWPAINGGQYCGRRDKMIAMMEVITSGKYRADQGGVWQEVMHQMYADHYAMGLDRRCSVFQSMTGAFSQEWVHKFTANPGVGNWATGGKPMMLHFNGRTPGIEDWYNKCFST